MSGFSQILRQLDWSVPLQLLLQAVPALICIMVHEICHGAMAYALGDSTAKTQGRLSLNPLRHVDWMGLVMLLLFHIGWAKPVQVDIRNFRYPKRDMALTALAGPASNFVLAAVFLFLYGAAYAPCMVRGYTWVLAILSSTAYLSVSLGLFNLIPFPPLDGSKILFAFLPDRAYVRLMQLERYGMIVLIAAVLLMSRVFQVSPVQQASEAVFQAMLPIAQWASGLTA
jgi:Zn-dependent protease